MKVNIGPYPDRVRSNIHNDYMDKKYGRIDWPEDYTLYETFLESAEKTIQKFYDYTINLILDRRKRKIKVRIDSYDVWSADHTMAVVIVPLLKRLNETKHGHPIPAVDDAPHIGKGEEEDFGNSDSLAAARWEWIMSEMIWAWEQLVDPNEDDGASNYYDDFAPDEVVTTGSRYFTEEDLRSLGKFNKEKFEAYNARKANGFRLFGKYLESLWD